ncbi:unnamed protein product, partial [Closterium sp. Naga37s-1]
MAGLHLMLEERPIAIIGPTTSSQVALLSGLAGTTRIPLLSYSATDPLLTTSRQWPYFMRTVPSDATKMEAIADLLALYRYRHFVAIFTDDRFGRNGISVLENILQNRWGWQHPVVARVALKRGREYDDARSSLEKLQQVRTSVMIIHAGGDGPDAVLKAAVELGMFSRGYVWITTEPTSLQSFTYDGATASFMPQVQGLISMASFVPPLPALTVFRAEWKEHMSGQEGPSSPKADVYSLAAYDALLLVAQAVHNVLSGDTTDGADSQNSLVEPVPPSQGPGAYNEDGAGSGSFPGVESGGVARAAGAAGAEGNSSSSDGSSSAAAAGSVFVSNSSAAGQEPGTWAHVPMPVVAPGDSASSLIPILSGAARSNFGPLLRDALLQASVMGATGRVRLTPEGDVKDGSVQLLNVRGSEFVTVGYWRMGKGFTTSDVSHLLRHFPSLHLSPLISTDLLSSLPLLSPPARPISDPLAPAVQANSSTTLNLLFPGNLEKAPSGWLARQQDPLRIAVPNKRGYNQFVEILPPTAAQGNDRFTGFCLDLFRAAVARLPYELSYEFLQFGEGDATPSYTEMVYAVANNTYDGAIGDIAVLNFRSEAVDFTVPIQQSGLSLVSYVAPNDNPWISYRPFSWQMWLLLACLIVFSGLVLCFLESSHPAHLLRREYDRPHQEVMSYIWMSFAPVGFAKVPTYVVVLTAALILSSLHPPLPLAIMRGIVKTSLGRILTVTWFALMIVVSSSYIAALTAALVLQKLQLPISSIYDAAGSDVMSIYDAAGSDVMVGYQYGSFVYGYLVQLGFSPLVPLNGEQEYYKALTSFFPPFSPSNLPLPQSRLVPLNGEQEYYKALTSFFPPFSPSNLPLPQSRLVPLNGEQEYYKALTSFFPPFSPSNLPLPQSRLVPLNGEQEYYKALTSFFPPFSPSNLPLPQSRLVPLNGEQEYYKALTSFFPPFSPSNLPRPQSCLMPLNSEQDYYKALTSFFPPFSPSHVPLPQSRLVPLTSEQDYYEAISSQRVAIVVGEDPLPQRLPLSRAPPTLPPTLIPHPQSRLVPLNSEQDYYEALTSQRVALIVDEDPYLNVFASQYCQMLRASQAFNVLNSAFVSRWGHLGASRSIYGLLRHWVVHGQASRDALITAMAITVDGDPYLSVFASQNCQAFQKGSLFGADISQALLELAQNGELQRIRSMYIKNTSNCDNAASVMVEKVQISATTMAGLMIVYGAFSLLCCAAYIAIILHRGHRAHRELKPYAFREVGEEGNFTPPTQPGGFDGNGGGPWRAEPEEAMRFDRMALDGGEVAGEVTGRSTLEELEMLVGLSQRVVAAEEVTFESAEWSNIENSEGAVELDRRAVGGGQTREESEGAVGLSNKAMGGDAREPDVEMEGVWQDADTPGGGGDGGGGDGGGDGEGEGKSHGEVDLKGGDNSAEAEKQKDEAGTQNGEADRRKDKVDRRTGESGGETDEADRGGAKEGCDVAAREDTNFETSQKAAREDTKSNSCKIDGEDDGARDEASYEDLPALPLSTPSSSRLAPPSPRLALPSPRMMPPSLRVTSSSPRMTVAAAAAAAVAAADAAAAASATTSATHSLFPDAFSPRSPHPFSKSRTFKRSPAAFDLSSTSPSSFHAPHHHRPPSLIATNPRYSPRYNPSLQSPTTRPFSKSKTFKYTNSSPSFSLTSPSSRTQSKPPPRKHLSSGNLAGLPLQRGIDQPSRTLHQVPPGRGLSRHLSMNPRTGAGGMDAFSSRDAGSAGVIRDGRAGNVFVNDARSADALTAAGLRSTDKGKGPALEEEVQTQRHSLPARAAETLRVTPGAEAQRVALVSGGADRQASSFEAASQCQAVVFGQDPQAAISRADSQASASGAYNEAGPGLPNEGAYDEGVGGAYRGTPSPGASRRGQLSRQTLQGHGMSSFNDSMFAGGGGSAWESRFVGSSSVESGFPGNSSFSESMLDGSVREEEEGEEEEEEEEEEKEGEEGEERVGDGGRQLGSGGHYLGSSGRSVSVTEATGSSSLLPYGTRKPGRGSRIIGTGSAVPKKIVTNDFLASLMETSDEWIATRTGIRNRHVLSENESMTGLATEASRKALEMAGVDPADVDLIIFCTSTPDDIFGGGCLIQRDLGCKRAVAFDLTAACSGFVLGLVTASRFIQGGGYERVLVVGADGLSRYVDWSDRGTCILFGDGCGAVLVQAAAEGESDGMLGFDMHSDGYGSRHLHACFSVTPAPEESGSIAGRAVATPIVMNGKEVYKFAVTSVPQVLQAALQEAELSTGDIDWLLLHQ